MNSHYYTRYQRFSQALRQRKLPPDAIAETHHMVPRCMGGSDDPDNLVELTLREHYLAHWMLWRAFPENQSLRFAFYAMCNKNFRTSHKKDAYQKIRHSRVYARLKEEFRQAHSERMAGKVRVRDEDGHVREMTSEEYREQDELKFHTSGMTYAIDLRSGEKVWIPVESYHQEDYYFRPSEGAWKNSQRIYVLDGEEVRLTYQDYLQLKDQGRDIKGKFYGDVEKCKNTVVVYDHQTGKNRKITLEQYQQDPARYRTATKGQVLARNRVTGESKLIPQDLFDSSDEWVGQTVGLTTVRDRITGQCVQVTTEQARDPRYEGLAAGKINVIHRSTGERKQISKSQYDPEVWCPLGDRKMAFRCRCKRTGKEKNIYIFEWHRVKDQFEVIDCERFRQLQESL